MDEDYPKKYLKRSLNLKIFKFIRTHYLKLYCVQILKQLSVLSIKKKINKYRSSSVCIIKTVRKSIYIYMYIEYLSCSTCFEKRVQTICVIWPIASLVVKLR